MPSWRLPGKMQQLFSFMKPNQNDVRIWFFASFGTSSHPVSFLIYSWAPVNEVPG
jgi:hypothetical protein